MDRKVIALDIGGTFIKYGIVDDKGRILYKAKRPTGGSAGGFLAVVESADLAVKELKEKYPQALAVCISTSGEYDRRTGIIKNATGVFIDLIGFNYKEHFESMFGITTVGENDAKCAAIAEKWKGAGQNTDEFLLVTIGTGIGGGIFSRGQLQSGQGAGGEIGHFRMVYDGLPCSCGGRGCFERYASMTALIEQAESALNCRMTGEEIFRAYDSGDERIVPVVELWLSYLTEGLVSLLHILNPEYLIIGGGISANRRVIREIDDRIRESAMSSYTKTLKVVPAMTGNDAGMLGAAWLYFGGSDAV